MKVLLTFLFVMFFLAVRAARRGRATRAWPVLAGSVIVAIALLSQRFI